MSALFAIFHRDGRPLAPEVIDNMARAQEHLSVDYNQRKTAGPVAMGFQMMCVAPESLNEQLPFKNETLLPCQMCEDFPCIEACETGALVMPEKGKKPPIGKAQIYIDSCLSWLDVECDVCVPMCPDSALIIDSENHVRVKEDLCTGCGICEQACPMGDSAIQVIPIEK